MSSRSRGLLFIVSAPSGTGKTTLVERLVHTVPGLRMSRSYTSRQARVGERDGVDYHFVSRERFEQMLAEGAFLEHAMVFGNYYGTSAADTETCLIEGDDLILVIDVQGARQVRSRGLESVGIFVLPPSSYVLADRLRGRSKDSEEQVRTRLAVSSREVGEFTTYDYLVINDHVEDAVDHLRAIVLAERSRVRRMRSVAEHVVATFSGATRAEG